MRYKNILFDLDGTLTDPYWGITNSVKYALDKYNIFEDDREKLSLFIGPPLEKSFREYYNLDISESKKAVEYYREYFSAKGIYENKMYKNIDFVLKELKNKNANCIVATSKFEIFARKILKNFKLDIYFNGIVGSNQDGSLSEKEDIIKCIIEKYKLIKEHTIMVGDRKYDIIGAKKNGIDSIAVTYGYGARKELEEAEPTYFCGNVMDIPGIVCQ